MLQEIQNRLFPVIAVWLYSWPRERYLNAARLLGVQTELGRRLMTHSSCDIRLLRYVYDQVACHYRDVHEDGQQMRFSFDEVTDELTHEERLARDWVRYYRDEVSALADSDDFAIPLLTMVAYDDSPKGGTARGWLNERLSTRYDHNSCEHCSWPPGTRTEALEEFIQSTAVAWNRSEQ